MKTIIKWLLRIALILLIVVFALGALSRCATDMNIKLPWSGLIEKNGGLGWFNNPFSIFNRTTLGPNGEPKQDPNKIDPNKEPNGDGDGESDVEYTVRFDSGLGGPIVVLTVKGKNQAIGDHLPQPPQIDGATFLGWFDGEEEITSETVVMRDISATAKWAEKFYDVIFNVLGEPTRIKVVENTAIGAQFPEVPTREGFTFVGWFTGEEEVTAETVVTSNMLVSARYEETVYSVTFVSMGTAVKTVLVKENTAIGSQFPESPEEEDLTFLGWYAGEEEITSETIVTQDITATAKWTEKYYTVLFKEREEADESQTLSVQVQAGNAIGELFPTAPERTGYTFGGWYEGADEITERTIVRKDITATAKWDIKILTVTFDDGTSKTERNIRYGERIGEVPSAAEKSGYLFIAWRVGERSIDENTVVLEDIYAVAYYLGLHTVRFIGRETTEPWDEEIADGWKIGNKMPSTPENTETHTFLGWYAGETEVTADTVVTADMVVVLQWETKNADDCPHFYKAYNSYTDTRGHEVTLSSCEKCGNFYGEIKHALYLSDSTTAANGDILNTYKCTKCDFMKTNTGHELTEVQTAETKTDKWGHAVKTYTCTHCGETVEFEQHSYVDGVCVYCGKIECEHEYEGNVCIKCGATKDSTIKQPDIGGGDGGDTCTEHVDADSDGKCDKCGADVSTGGDQGGTGGDEECKDHVDANNDGKCDKCGADVSTGGNQGGTGDGGDEGDNQGTESPDGGNYGNVESNVDQAVLDLLYGYDNDSRYHSSTFMGDIRVSFIYDNPVLFMSTPIQFDVKHFAADGSIRFWADISENDDPTIVKFTGVKHTEIGATVEGFGYSISNNGARIEGSFSGQYLEGSAHIVVLISTQFQSILDRVEFKEYGSGTSLPKGTVAFTGILLGDKSDSGTDSVVLYVEAPYPDIGGGYDIADIVVNDYTLFQCEDDTHMLYTYVEVSIADCGTVGELYDYLFGNFVVYVRDCYHMDAGDELNIVEFYDKSILATGDYTGDEYFDAHFNYRLTDNGDGTATFEYRIVTGEVEFYVSKIVIDGLIEGDENLKSRYGTDKLNGFITFTYDGNQHVNCYLTTQKETGTAQKIEERVAFFINDDGQRLPVEVGENLEITVNAVSDIEVEIYISFDPSICGSYVVTLLNDDGTATLTDKGFNAYSVVFNDISNTSGCVIEIHLY